MYSVKYLNTEDFISDIVNHKRSENKDHDEWDSETGSPEWSGSKDFQQALEFARHGDNVDKIETTLQRIDEAHSEMTPVVEVSGAVVHMGNFLEGIPENMVDFPIVENTNFVHLIFNIVEHSGRSKTFLMNKSIAIANLIDNLESKNFRVKLSVLMASSGSGSGKQSRTMALVNVKEYKEPLSIGQLAGATSPSFFRRLMFRWMEKHIVGLSRGYGRPADPTEEEQKELFGNDEYTYIPTTGYQGFDLNSLQGAIKYAEHFGNIIMNKTQSL